MPSSAHALTAIPSVKTLSVVVRQVTNGGSMPAFSGTPTQKQIDDVVAYVIQTITNKK